jgi:hypothetical protein
MTTMSMVFARTAPNVNPVQQRTGNGVDRASLPFRICSKRSKTDSFNDLGVKVTWTDNYDEGFPRESLRSATSTVIPGLRRGV